MSPGREQEGGTQSATLKPGMWQRSSAGEEALGKLLLPPLLPRAQQAETAPAGPRRAAWAPRGKRKGKERPPRRHSHSTGTASSSGCDRGRKRRRKEEGGRGGVTIKFRLFPAAGRLRGVTAEVDARLWDRCGCLDAPRALEAGAGLGSAAWLGVGQPAWKRLQEAFPGLGLFTRQRWEGGRVGSGRAGSEGVLFILLK